MMQRNPSLLTVLGVLVLIAGELGAEERPVSYNRDIRPLLSDRCFQCHGPDNNQRQTEMRLDERSGVVDRRLESGAVAIRAGKPRESEVVARITTTDADLRMPPPDSGKTLSPEEATLIAKWIKEGARYEKHWSFTPPTQFAPPATRFANRVVNSIDHFAFARLEKAGLAPNPEARRAELIRRVTFDLTGLPPTLAEIDAFVNDTSPRSYERLVDRLLQSPRYGEHMARFWLDAARYGDTHGLHLDNERSIWLYRDWVIRAFNDNMPFDQFTIEQLAGDLLEDATVDQRVATGFNRCNVTTSEGGSIRKEYRVRYAIDRVETTATVWLGLTAGCAACHEHKFDPISQREFYQLFAYFYSFQEDAMDGNALLPAPVVAKETAAVAAQRVEVKAELDSLQNEIKQRVAAFEYVEPKQPATTTDGPQDFVWIDDDAPAGASLQGHTAWRWVTKDEHSVASGNRATARTAEGLSQHFFLGAKPLLIGANDRLFAHVFLDPQNPPQEIMLQFHAKNWEHRAIWGADKIDWGKPNTVSRVHKGELPTRGKWVRLEVAAAEVGLRPGAKIDGWAFTQFDGTVYWDHCGAVTSTPQSGGEYASLTNWLAAQRTNKGQGLPAAVGKLVREANSADDPPARVVVDYFVEHVFSGSRAEFVPLHSKQQVLRQRLESLNGELPKTLVMADKSKPLPTYVLTRGQYDREDKSQPVKPGVPTFLPALPPDAPANRLGLARWLVNPEHPLTARVTVNRIWQQYFGQGLVRTSEDFGSQGEWPSHPELLDWLALEFVKSGWDVKGMHKLIVMSAVYRQSGRVSPQRLVQDPENILLSRGPRHRLDAEQIRDNALALSGLLVEQIGGKSVRPYQPSGLWRAVGYSTSNTSKFQRQSGAALYRRSLYTFWKRTSPPPTMTIFDAPSREACTVRRSRTNTPQQALATMNDEQFVEASRFFAERVLVEGGGTDEERLKYAFRTATSRVPDADDLAIIRFALKTHRQHFRDHPMAAVQLTSVGEKKRNPAIDVSELAAWTMVANLLLNLDETLSKG